jgi:hypothetical protein
MKISNTAIETTIHSAQLHGNNNCSDYYFFNSDTYCDVTIVKDGVENTYNANLQPGQYYYHGDYSLPSENIDYSHEAGCHEFIIGLCNSDAESLDDDEVSELCEDAGASFTEAELLTIRAYIIDLQVDAQIAIDAEIEDNGQNFIDECDANLEQEREYAKQASEDQENYFNQ